MKAARPFIGLGTWWRWVVNVTPQLPNLRQRTPTPIETNMHRPQNLSGWRKSLALARIWIPDQLAHSLLYTRQYYHIFSVTSKQGLFRVSTLKGNNNPTTTSENNTEHLHLNTYNNLPDSMNKQLLMHVQLIVLTFCATNSGAWWFHTFRRQC